MKTKIGEIKRFSQDPKQWGQDTWITWLGLTTEVPFHGLPAKRSIELLHFLLMCFTCKEHFGERLHKQPLTKHWLTSNKRIRQWLEHSRKKIAKDNQRPFRELPILSLSSKQWTHSFFNYLYFLFGHYIPEEKEENQELLGIFISFIRLRQAPLANELQNVFFEDKDSKARWNHSLYLMEGVFLVNAKIWKIKEKDYFEKKVKMVHSSFLHPPVTKRRPKEEKTTSCTSVCSLKE